MQSVLRTPTPEHGILLTVLIACIFRVIVLCNMCFGNLHCSPEFTRSELIRLVCLWPMSVKVAEKTHTVSR